MAPTPRMSLTRWLRKDKEYKLNLFGADSSGKTTMLYRLKLGEFVQVIPTIGFNIETIQYPKGFKFNIWDLGGCSDLRHQMILYVSPESLVFFLHDSSNPDGIDDSVELLHVHVRQMIDTKAEYLWVLLNKQDLLLEENREEVIAGQRRRFETELARYDGVITWKIIAEPGLSGSTGEHLYHALDSVHETLSRAADKTKTIEKTPVELPQEFPSDDELRKQIEKDADSFKDAATYWAAFLDGTLPTWNHRDHLHAGYIVLIDSFGKGEGVFESVDIFLAHLGRLREAQPDRFRNTAHKTMTTFWLLNLHVAAVNYQRDHGLDAYPSSDNFRQVLLHTPSLMNTRLWSKYYTKDLLFSPGSREDWRLPDLEPLPTIQVSQESFNPTKLVQQDPDTLPHFAFIVVQKTIVSKMRRGALIKQALESLEMSTMRARASYPSTPPYSETQAYFWIQFIHAALGSMEAESVSTLGMSLSRLDFSSFKILFGLNGTEWQKYYSAKVWNSVAARMQFTVPDLTPLPNIIQTPSKEAFALLRVKMIEKTVLGIGDAPLLPPFAELAFTAAMLIEDAATLPLPTSPEITTHAHLLLYLYTQLVVAQSMAASASTVLLALAGPANLSHTAKSFWIRQVLATSGAAKAADPSAILPPSFEEFVKTHLHLVFEGLPYFYYSPEMWNSGEAKVQFILPDRKPLPGFVRVAENQPLVSNGLSK